MPNQIIISQ